MQFVAVVCDGCSVARVEIPLPDKSIKDTAWNAAAHQGWVMIPFLGGAQLCPACRALTEIDLPAEPETEAMF